ncbi:chitinase [Roridomyces roridus]|uniref:Chitinase n=1 Tax=Roridomyces roridus TaxID=1738132 RepID=A0AAD7C5B6_9AGAR|nr:chitinase [Roridomyces roridus]
MFTLLPLSFVITFLHGAALAANHAAPSIAMGWYAGFHGANVDPAFGISQIPWDRYTHLAYSFAVTTPDVRLVTLNASEPELLPQFVSAAHSHGVKAMVAVGGWTGSLYWSSNVATAANRTAFVNTLVSFATQYNLDGLNFDWEYPSASGIGCNTNSPNDTANFLSFLQELRQDPVGAKLILSAATAITPFIDADGKPSTDVSGFAKVLDHIAAMVYDVNGAWSPAVGPNGPLKDACAPAAFQAGSATSAVDAWHAAGMPLNQIVLGVPAYGHSFAVNTTEAFTNGSKTELALYAAFNATAAPAGDSWDDPPAVDECGNLEAQGGVIQFWGLIEQGYLNADGLVNHGVPYLYDTCTETPYVYNTTTEVMISFDNARSFKAKGKFIRSQGLAGFAVWEAGGDSNNILVDSIRRAAGFR